MKIRTILALKRYQAQEGALLIFTIVVTGRLLFCLCKGF
jgi:hypothetical protein